MKKLSFVLCLITNSIVHAQLLDDLEFGTDSTLDIITWNIEWFPKNGTSTIDSVSKIISLLQPDIIACQEIDDTVEFNNMMSDLPNYNGVYDSNYFEGLAYIYNTSTIQLLDHYSIYTSGNYWRPFPRSPYLLKTIYQNETYFYINNHLKCCGNGLLDLSDIDDEENRRLEASTLLETYISSNFSNDNVILLGDFNDDITDTVTHNVFQPFFDSPSLFQFTDYLIASGNSSNWSYPSWPSHLDHILITDELFTSFNHPNSSISTIKIDDYLANGFTAFDAHISDHRPVGLKLFIDPPFLANNKVKMHPKFDLYPNPSSNRVNLLYESANNVTVTVYNCFGQVVIEEKSIHLLLDREITVSHLNPGLYFIVISENGQILETKKLYIQ